MAVNNTWNAITDTLVNTAASPPWSAGTAPANSEVILFPDGNSFSALGASLTSVDLAEMIVARGYSGAIGSSGTPLTISSNLVRMYGSGSLYYTDGGGTTDLLIVDAASPSTVVQLGGATFTTVILLRGALTINGTVTNLRVGTHSGTNADATCVINSGGGIATNIYQYSGSVTSSSGTAHTIWNMAGGSATRNTGGAITNLTVGAGANMVYKSTSTMASADVGPRGTLDLSQVQGALTITELIEHPQSVVRGAKESGLITITKRWELGDATP